MLCYRDAVLVATEVICNCFFASCCVISMVLVCSPLEVTESKIDHSSNLQKFQSFYADLLFVIFNKNIHFVL